MRVLGIDYGKRGAMVLVSGTAPLGPSAIISIGELEGLYRESDGMIDDNYVRQLLPIDVDVVYIEDFLVRYKTVPHIRSLRNHERLIMALERRGIKVVRVTGATWKRALGLYGLKDKDASVELAIDIWGRGPFHGRPRHDVAEAALIGYYGLTQELS